MEVIKIKSPFEIPKNFTGIAEYPSGTKYWYKEGKCHRLDGPAAEYSDGEKEWWVEGKYYSENKFKILIETSIFLEKKEKTKYGLDWLLFLTDEGIEEFPIIPGMIETKLLKKYLDAVQ